MKQPNKQHVAQYECARITFTSINLVHVCNDKFICYDCAKHCYRALLDIILETILCSYLISDVICNILRVFTLSNLSRTSHFAAYQDGGSMCSPVPGNGEQELGNI